MDKDQNRHARWGVSIVGTLLLVACATSTFDWKAEYSGADGEGAEAAAITVDSEGNTVLTGSDKRSSQPSNTRWFISKYDSQGGEQWVHYINGSVLYGEDTRGRGIEVLNHNGAIYTLGTLDIPGGNPRSLVLAKIDQEGDRVWTHQVDDIFLDAKFVIHNDEILVVGVAANSLSEKRLHTLKVAEDGTVLWQNQADFGDLILEDMEVDASGGFYLTSNNYETSDIRYFAASGELVWQQSFSLSEKELAFVDLTLDSEGHLYVIGHETPVNSSSADAVIYKFSSDGQQIWNTKVNHPLFAVEYGNHIKWYNNQIYAVINGGTLAYNGDVVLLGANPENGETNWKRVFNGGVNSIDKAPAFQITSQGEALLLVETLLMVTVIGGYTTRAHITHEDGTAGGMVVVKNYRGVDVDMALDGGIIVGGDFASIYSDKIRARVYKFPQE